MALVIYLHNLFIKRWQYLINRPSVPSSDHTQQTTRRDAIRRILGGAAATLFASGAAGCRPGGSTKGKVTLWHVWTSKNLVSFNSMMDRFLAQHPSIKVESTYVPADFLRNRFMAALRSGLLPDLVMINSSWLRIPASEQQLRNLLPLAKSDELRLTERLTTRDYDRCLREQALLALPLSSASGGTMLYYNKSVLAKAGLTTKPHLRNWSEFTELSREVVERLNQPGGELVTLAWDPYSYAGSQFLMAFALGAGAPLISRDGRFSLMKEPGVQRVFEALETHVQTVYARFGGYRGILRWRQRVGDPALNSQVNPFVNGVQAFILSGAWLAGNLINATPRPDFDVSPVPGLDRPHGGIAAHGWAYGMRAAPNDLEAAWTLLKYLTVDAEGNGRFAVEWLRPSPIRSVNDSDAYAGMGEVWDSIRLSMAMDVPYPYSVDSDLLRVFMQEYPFRRLRGDGLQSIIENFHQRLQANLDALAREGLQ